MIYYILLCVIIALLVGYVLYLKHKKLEIITINESTIKANQDLKKQIGIKQIKLLELKETIQTQNNILNSLVDTTQKMQENAEKQADQIFQDRMKEVENKLAEYYSALSADYQHNIDILDEQKKKEENKLQDLKDKQLAYIQAQQRQEEINKKQDYYRLIITDDDKSDIFLLRDLQKHLIKKESVDKIIWETYYKSAYDVLMTHLFESTAKVSGIYRITSLSLGQSYIGQSVDLRERIRQHIKAALTYGKVTNKLYQTMQKFGPEDFTFEVLEKVPKDKLNEREVYWIDFYKTKELGLNVTRGGS